MALVNAEVGVVPQQCFVAAVALGVEPVAAEHLGEPAGKMLDVLCTDLGAEDLGQDRIGEAAAVDDRIYAARYSLADPSLAPPGHELIQVSAACAPRERKTDAELRVQRLLDQSWPGWRAAVQWYRSSVRTHCTGAVDLPGTTWRDRPAVSRGVALAVATDQSAAPGLLAETGITAARLAVGQLAGIGGDGQPARLTGSGRI